MATDTFRVGTVDDQMLCFDILRVIQRDGFHHLPTFWEMMATATASSWQSETIGFGISDQQKMLTELERTESCENLVSSLSGPKSQKEYAKLVSAIEVKSPKLDFFNLLNQKINKKKKKFGDEKKLTDFLDSHPELCSELYRFEAFPDDLLHPFHMMIAHRVSGKVLKKTLKCCEAALYYDVSRLGAPIHFAVSFQASIETLKLLAKKDPDSLFVQNEDLQSPLHLAITKHPEIVDFLTEKCPGSASLEDHHGNTALHLACQHGSPLAIIEDLTEVHANAGLVKNHAGLLPIEIAMEKQADFAILHDLLISCPQIAHHEFQGEFLLHKALQNQSVEFLRDVYKANPETIQMVNPAGDLPVHIAVRHGRGMDVFVFLARKFSDGLDIPNAQGVFAFEMADELGMDPAIADYLNPFEMVEEEQ